MKVERDIYYIRTIDSPIEVHYGGGNMSDIPADAELYDSIEEAEAELDKFDKKERFCIGKGKIQLEI